MEVKNKLKYTMLLAILAAACVLVYVFYSHKYNLAYTILPLLFLFVVWMFVTDIWVPSSWTNKLPFIVQRLIYALLFGGVFAVLSSWRVNYEEGQLKKYGVVVDGKVTDTRIVDERQGSHFYVEIEYNFDGKIYKQHLTNSIYTYRYHDELKVLCSSRDPEIFVITGHKSALDIKY